jgi:hypothetical protein
MSTATCRPGALAGLVGLALGLAACAHDYVEGPDDSGVPTPGMGQHPEANQACLDCHTNLGPRWALPSSHGQLLDCTHCHGTYGPGGVAHSDSRPCGDCHSQGTHPTSAACTVCHDPHGTANAFLVKETIAIRRNTEVPVHFTTVEGASADGLVRAGVAGAAAGTGLCEVCHTSTRYYPSSGAGAAHETGWCPRCHLHQNGFGLGLP